MSRKQSSDGAEGDRQEAETNRIAAEGNRISAEGERQHAEAVREDHTKFRRRRRRRVTMAQLVAYLLIVTVAVFGFYQIDQQNQTICSSTGDNREAIRNVVKAIDRLGVSLVLEGRRSMENATPGEEAAVERIRAFSAQQLRLLETKACPDG